MLRLIKVRSRLWVIAIPFAVFACVKFLPTSKESSEFADFRNWININIGDLEQRRLQWRMYTNHGKERYQRLPDVIGIGVRKCGTGALQQFIQHHPLIRISSREAHFYDQHYEKGLDYYRHIMPNATLSEKIAEKTPAYFRSRPFDLPNIIDHDIPGVKLWLMLCDPVQRAFSDFIMRMSGISADIADYEIRFEKYINRHMETVQQLFNNWTEDSDELWEHERVFSTLEKERPAYAFAHGIYAYYITRWLKVFPPDRLLIIDGEEHLNDPGTVIERVQDFLHVPKLLQRRDLIRHPKTGLFCIRPWWDSTYNLWAEFRSDSTWEISLLCTGHKKGRTRSTDTRFSLPVRLKSRLDKFFQPYNQRLYKTLNRTFSW